MTESCTICGLGEDYATDWISCDSCDCWAHLSCDKRPYLGEPTPAPAGRGLLLLVLVLLWANPNPNGLPNQLGQSVRGIMPCPEPPRVLASDMPLCPLSSAPRPSPPLPGSFKDYARGRGRTYNCPRCHESQRQQAEAAAAATDAAAAEAEAALMAEAASQMQAGMTWAQPIAAYAPPQQEQQQQQQQQEQQQQQQQELDGPAPMQE